MGTTREKVGKAGLALLGLLFHVVFYVCMGVLIFWCGKQAYQFGYQVFDQEAVSPGEGVEIQVTVPEGASDYAIARILEQAGLVKDARVFYVQSLLSDYHGDLQAGTYMLSTAYTPSRMMSIISGAEESVQEETA